MNRTRRTGRFSRMVQPRPPFLAGARVRVWPSAALMIAGILFCGAARADFDRRLWNTYLTHATECGPSLNAAASDGARCLLASGLGLMVDGGLRVADAYGKGAFGRHFQAAGRLSHAPFSDGSAIHGEIDMVLPFAGAGAPFGRREGSALFFQQGVTRSWDGDGQGVSRSDLRQGVVRRLRISTAPAAGILGISAFHLFNLERGHRVVVSGVDYAGRWGVGSLRHHLPTTGWRPGASGQEERALEGLEAALRVDLTTTLRLEGAGYRWRAEDGSNRWDTGARLDVDWRPHPWIKLGAGYDGIGRGKRTASLRVVLHVPPGRGSKPAWQGLGAAIDPSTPAVRDLWRPVEGVGAIRVAARAAAVDPAGRIRVRFLRPTVASGGTVRLELMLPAAAAEDMRVVVRVVPGDGDNPAVAGEDFIDEPVETTIRKGTASRTVSFTLLRNYGMKKNRSLGARVSTVS